jgi:hypothetical protein
MAVGWGGGGAVPFAKPKGTIEQALEAGEGVRLAGVWEKSSKQGDQSVARLQAGMRMGNERPLRAEPRQEMKSGRTRSDRALGLKLEFGVDCG